MSVVVPSISHKITFIAFVYFLFRDDFCTNVFDFCSLTYVSPHKKFIRRWKMAQLTRNGDFSPDLASKLQHSVSVLEKAFEQYDKKQIFLSFNGGKDCTVLLHMLSEILKDSVRDLKVIYFRTSEPFDEIEEFVKSCEGFYGITICTLQSDTSMKVLLTNICNSDPDISACIMGSRRTDPYCENLNSFQSTDRGWPKLMRVNAMLDWNCRNVWEYLLKKRVPYCSLYDQGYTSIGSRANTRPNPQLEVNGTFLPAYELADDALERAGRLSAKH